MNIHFRIYVWNFRLHHFDTHCVWVYDFVLINTNNLREFIFMYLMFVKCEINFSFCFFAFSWVEKCRNKTFIHKLDLRWYCAFIFRSFCFFVGCLFIFSSTSSMIILCIDKKWINVFLVFNIGALATRLAS